MFNYFDFFIQLTTPIFLLLFMHTYSVYFSSLFIVSFVVFIYVFLWYSLLIILYSTHSDIFDVLDYVFYFSYWDSCLSIWDFFFNKGLSTYNEVPPFLLIFGWFIMFLFFNLIFYFIPRGYFYLFSFFLFSFWYIVLLNTYWRNYGIRIFFSNFLSINWLSYSDNHVATHIEYFRLSLSIAYMKEASFILVLFFFLVQCLLFFLFISNLSIPFNFFSLFLSFFLLTLLLLLNVSSAYALGIRVVDILLVTVLFFFLMFVLFPEMVSSFF